VFEESSGSDESGSDCAWRRLGFRLCNVLTRAVDEGDDSDESGSFEDDESGEDWDELERKAKKCTCGSLSVAD
jgi:nucleosome binding factor SPN SPT16 subunit